MNPTLRLPLTLAIVAGASALILAVAYNLTRNAREWQNKNASVNALAAILFADLDDEGNLVLEVKPKDAEGTVLALFRRGRNEPVYFAAVGAGSGYNPSVPIRALVVFTNPALEARPLLEPYMEGRENALPAAGEKGAFLVGFRVVASEETPGLGEKIRDTRPARTWADIARGRPPDPSPDDATPFQSQFRGRDPQAVALANVDVITGATVTTRGLMTAFRDARRVLGEVVPIPEANSGSDAATGATDVIPPKTTSDSAPVPDAETSATDAAPTETAPDPVLVPDVETGATD